MSRNKSRLKTARGFQDVGQPRSKRLSFTSSGRADIKKARNPGNEVGYRDKKYFSGRCRNAIFTELCSERLGTRLLFASIYIVQQSDCLKS